MSVSSTHGIGKEAVEKVKEYEEKQGRKVTPAKQGLGYDVKSEGTGDDIRKIEVKAESGPELMSTHGYALTLREWNVFRKDKHA